jgi:hypothetical protein
VAQAVPSCLSSTTRSGTSCSKPKAQALLSKAVRGSSSSVPCSLEIMRDIHSSLAKYWNVWSIFILGKKPKYSLGFRPARSHAVQYFARLWVHWTLGWQRYLDWGVYAAA